MHLQRIFIFLLNIHHKFFLKNHMKADQLPLLLLLLLYFENRNLIQWINEKKLLCLYIKFTFFFVSNGSLRYQIWRKWEYSRSALKRKIAKTEI